MVPLNTEVFLGQGYHILQMQFTVSSSMTKESSLVLAGFKKFHFPIIFLMLCMTVYQQVHFKKIFVQKYNLTSSITEYLLGPNPKQVQ